MVIISEGKDGTLLVDVKVVSAKGDGINEYEKIAELFPCRHKLSNNGREPYDFAIENTTQMRYLLENYCSLGLLVIADVNVFDRTLELNGKPIRLCTGEVCSEEDTDSIELKVMTNELRDEARLGNMLKQRIAHDDIEKLLSGEKVFLSVTVCPVATPVGDTGFSFSESTIFYNNHPCDTTPRIVYLISLFFREYNAGSEMVPKEKILSYLKSKYAGTYGYDNMYARISEANKLLRNVTKASSDTKFIAPCNGKGYRFIPHNY